MRVYDPTYRAYIADIRVFAKSWLPWSPRLSFQTLEKLLQWVLTGFRIITSFNTNMVPTGTGKQRKPGKMGRHFPVREFCQDWKSQGILLKILEKSKKNKTGKLKKKYWKSQGNLSASNSENPENIGPYFE